MCLKRLSQLLSHTSSPSSKRHRVRPVWRAGVKPALETLEDRLTPSSFAHSAGGSHDDVGAAIASGPSGGSYVTGRFTDTMQFHDGTQLLSVGDEDIFVARYSPAGALLWARGFGAAGFDVGSAITLDGAGNVLVTGQFHGPVNFQGATLTGGGAFVLKLDPAGHTLWAREFTCDGLEGASGNGIAVDAQNNVYTTGAFSRNIDLDPGPALAQFSHGYIFGYELYVSKLNAGGNFVWGYQAKSDINGDSKGVGLAVNGKNEVYLTGEFAGNADFDPAAVHAGNTDLLSSASNIKGYVLRLSGAGQFTWVRPIDAVTAFGSGVALGPGGTVNVTGSFQGTGHFGPLSATSAGDYDIFVAQLNAAGQFLWARGLGAAGFDVARSIAVDVLGNVFTTGEYEKIVDFDPGAGAFPLTSNGAGDVFISELDKAGKFVCATHLGGAQGDVGFGIAVDPNGFIDTTGSFSGNPSPFGVNAGGTDVFVAKRPMLCKGPNPFALQGSTLVATGSAGADHFEFMDDGSGVLHACADEDCETLTFTGIDRIVVRTFGGNDVIRYTGVGPVSLGSVDGGGLGPAALDMDLGRGSDTAIVRVQRAAFDNDWHFNLSGGPGDDTVWFSAEDVLVQHPLAINLNGDAGRDSFIIAFLNVQVTAPLTINLVGGTGNNTAIIGLLNVIWIDGTQPVAVNFLGGHGNDRAWLDVALGITNEHGTGRLAILLDGAGGNDRLAANIRSIGTPEL